MPVHFFSEQIDFVPSGKIALRKWITAIIHDYRRRCGELNIIFCSDDYLLSLNLQYLQHDYYTDIITFPGDAPGTVVQGDLYISIDRVKDNAQGLGISFLDELHRVIIHGVLHLLGYDDADDQQRGNMRRLEDQALSRLVF